MLAVLSIYGILTLTGIYGFQYLINKHRANSILGEAQMHATLLTGNALNNGLPENIVLNNMSYQFTYKKESDVAYSLNLSGIDKSVCKILWSTRDLGWAETVLLNNGTDCTEENTLSIYINTSMSTETTDEKRVMPCESDADCGECGTCSAEQKVCVYSDSLCPNSDKKYCNKGTCRECPVGQMLTRNNICRSCTDSELWFQTNGIANATEQCALCPNRKVGYNTCYLPCPEGKKFSTSGECSDTCTERYKYWTVYQHSNQTQEEYNRALQDCFSCNGVPNSSNGMCYSCNNTSQTFRTKYCSLCSNRIEIANGSAPWCAYPCESGKTLYIGTGSDAYGLCALCSTEEDLSITGIPEGYRCTCPGERYIDGNLCKKCPNNISGLNAEQQAQCTP